MTEGLCLPRSTELHASFRPLFHAPDKPEIKNYLVESLHKCLQKCELMETKVGRSIHKIKPICAGSTTKSWAPSRSWLWTCSRRLTPVRGLAIDVALHKFCSLTLRRRLHLSLMGSDDGHRPQQVLEHPVLLQPREGSRMTSIRASTG